MEGQFQLGPWLVQPNLNSASRNGTSKRLTPKAMEVLVCLAQCAGEPVSKEHLIEEVWPQTFVGDDALKSLIAEIRRVLEDDAKQPRIIETIAKRGYRLIAPIEWVNGEPCASAEQPQPEAVRAPLLKRKFQVVGWAILAGGLVLLLLGVLNVARVQNWLRPKRSAQIRSIAVLPLRNLSTDANQEYLCDGLTDGLITDLAQINSLKVISHTSTMQYKDAKKSLPDIAKELNVDGIVEGAVQRSGDRVRITAQLIDGPSDRHIWANTYERGIGEVFALEREVTEDIAREVQLRLTAPNGGQPPVPRPVDPRVLEAYLQGNFHLSRYGEGSGEEELKKASEYFQQAIASDPNFALAYLGLANAHGGLLRGSSEDAALVKRNLEKAVELDPNSSDAQAALGFMKWQPYLDWRGAEEHLRRAIALNPSNADARYKLGLLLIVMGRADAGLRECKIGQQLDPNSDESSLCFFHVRDYDSSMAVERLMLEKDPSNGFLHCFLFNNYYKKGMQKEAMEEMAACWRLFGSAEGAAKIEHALAVSGPRVAMREWANDLEGFQATHQAFLPGNLAIAYTILGDKDRAFYWLEQAYEHREMVSIDGGVFFLGSDPMYDPLRSDPRYKDLLRRIGLPQ